MISEENIKYSLRNLKKNKGRSFLTIFSIMVGIATIFIFISFGYGLYNYTNEMSSSSSADKVFIAPQTAGGFGSVEGIVLNDDDVNAVEKASGVYDATGLYYGSALVKQNSDQRYVFLISFDPKKDFIFSSFNVDIEEGRQLKSGDMAVALLGYNYLIPDKIFPKAFRINDKIEVNGVDLKVIGFVEEVGNPQDDSQVYVTNEQFLEMDPDEESYGQLIAVVDVNQIEKVVENIEKSLRKSRGLEEGKEDFNVQSFDELLEDFANALNIIIWFVLLIAFISVIVSTINTANTMITSVLERYKEIGILKAVGAKNIEVFKIFLFESSFLGFVAGCLGCLLGWIISFSGGVILDSFGWGFLQPYFSVYLFVGLILFAVVTGAISGVLPAMRASKINTVDALRHE